MKSRRTAFFLLGVVALVSACATAGPKTGVGAGHDPLVINADEINPVNQAYVIDVVKQVRPNWLTMNSNLGSGIKRATGFAVYEDNKRVGDLEMLRIIPTSEVLSIRFYDTNHAAALPGMGSDVVLGAIVLTMKH
jgi:hypothetical protein